MVVVEAVVVEGGGDVVVPSPSWLPIFSVMPPPSSPSDYRKETINRELRTTSFTSLVDGHFTYNPQKS